MTISTDTTKITIEDEPTREAVLLALWRTMGDPVGESLWSSVVMDAGCPGDAETVELARAELDDRLARLVAIRAQIDAVAQASLGATVDLNVSLADALDLLRDQRQCMEENADLVFRARAEERERMVVTYDAAGALVEQLSTLVEAGA